MLVGPEVEPQRKFASLLRREEKQEAALAFDLREFDLTAVVLASPARRAAEHLHLRLEFFGRLGVAVAILRNPAFVARHDIGTVDAVHRPAVLVRPRQEKLVDGKRHNGRQNGCDHDTSKHVSGHLFDPFLLHATNAFAYGLPVYCTTFHTSSQITAHYFF